MYHDPQQKVPISGRESTVKRAMNESPGTPSPDGKLGVSVGLEVLASPSSAFPASSLMRSKIVRVNRSSGSGISNCNSMKPHAIELLPGSPAAGKTAFDAGQTEVPAAVASDTNVALTISISPHWSPTSLKLPSSCARI